jgi:SulP family sulfate permease
MGETDEAASRPWPAFRALQGFRPDWVGRDLLAGLTLAAIAIPEQMATARLAGLGPQAGLIAFSAATLGFVVFGASRQLSAGADSTIAPIFAAGLAAFAAAGSAGYAQSAALLAVMVGLILCLAGLLKLGWVADLLSRPVTTGFLAGIALHILVSQAPAALGVAPGSGDLFRRVGAIVAQVGRINVAAALIAAGVFAVSLAAERLNPRIPGALIGLVGAALVTAWLGLDRHGVAVLGALPNRLPAPSLPSLGAAPAIRLVGLAFVIALVVMVQTGATTRAFTVGDEEPDVARDYIGVGVGGLMAGVFGAFPVDASPPRTAAVAAAGGQSQLSGLSAAAIILILTLFGGRLVAQAPIAAFAGVLLFIARRLVHYKDFAELAERTRAEFALALTTVALIVVLPIETGVAIGMFLSLAHGVFTITRARLIPFERAPGTTVWWPATPASPGETEPGVLVMGFQAPLSFLNAYEFRHDARAAVQKGQAKLFVLEASNIVEIDFTAASVLAEVVAKAHEAKVEFAVARLESVRAQAAFKRFGLDDQIGQDHIFRSVAEAIAALADRAREAGSNEEPTRERQD